MHVYTIFLKKSSFMKHKTYEIIAYLADFGTRIVLRCVISAYFRGHADCTRDAVYK